MENPNRGYCEPEHLPHDQIIDTARPYLGPMVSMATDWSPVEDRNMLFNDSWSYPEDPWQFGNFIVQN